MAINRIDLEVYDDEGMQPEHKIGNTITTDGSSLNIQIDDTTLGGEELIRPGEKYWVKAKAYNTEGFESEWSDGEFITMPYPSSQIIEDTVPYLRWWATFDASLITIAYWGVSLSKNEDGTDAVNFIYDEPIYTPDEHTENKYLYGLDEHTEYFYVPFCMDNFGRYYEGKWTDAYSFVTRWNAPYVNILSSSTTTDSITLTIDRQTNDTFYTKTYIVIDGKSVEVSDGVKGVGTYTITNGDVATDDSTITILPNTQYTIEVRFATSDAFGSATTTVTTASSAFVSAEIQLDRVAANQISFFIAVDTDDPDGVALVELRYKKQGASAWTTLQTENEIGMQGAFVIQAQPSTTYIIDLYAEDVRGEQNSTDSVIVTTPAS